MDDVTVANVNSALERLNSQIADITRQMEAQDALAENHASRQKKWAETQVQIDEKHADMYVRSVDALEESNARRQLARDRFAAKGDENARQNEQDAAELREIDSEVLELRKRLAEIPVLEKVEAEKVSVTRSQMDRHIASIDQSKRRDARGAAKLQNVIEVYERALGLVVDFSDPDRLTYKFTCIDEKDVSKEHCVVIRRREADSKSFELLLTEPSVPEFDKLARDFEESMGQDVGPLLKGARRAFFRLYTTH